MSMHRRSTMGLRVFLFVLAVGLLCWSTLPNAFGQTETARLTGRVTDPSSAVIPGADLKILNLTTGISVNTTSNSEGIYSFPSLMPGKYRIIVHKDGFRETVLDQLVLNVQDIVEQNFKLSIGSVSESVTVTADALNLNTSDATVSTVVDRNFAENLPLNGRSFQSLIQLTPGVVLTGGNSLDAGQFSVNGQRAVSNYWMVDGVSANTGASVSSPGNGLGGTLGSFSALGGTNSLVSVDAMQEFRIQTSTYAPEFGRTPGGQISIITRSGTNQFHGAVFDYLRNDALDANNWFANSVRLAKPRERQNDFGGTFSGPLIKDRTFFFFSYEGLRLRLPQTTLATVPDLNARQTAVAAMQTFLNAFPLPTPGAPDNLTTGVAQFNASYSNPATLDAYSLRVDHKVRDKLNLFGRYNYSPSEIDQRGNGSSLSTVSNSRITTQTATVGATWIVSPTITNDARFNYSRANASSRFNLDNFGGAVPLGSLPFPSPFTAENGFLSFQISSLQAGILQVGQNDRNLQRQINIVDTLSVQKGSHSLKFGVDFRRLSPLFEPSTYFQRVFFRTVPSAENGSLLFSFVGSSGSPTFLFRNLGIYAQDTWHIVSRLTLTYGVRWDVDFVPKTLNGPAFPAVTGFNLNNLSNLALAPAGTPPYKTLYSNFAPRVGVAYQLSQSQDRQTVIRGGFGVFYDLATSEMGNNISTGTYPFGNAPFKFGGSFPLSPAAAVPPPVAAPSTSSPGRLFALDPNLNQPYAFEWNIAVEQAVGKQQTISASYIGARGRRLLQSAIASSPTASISMAQLVTNGGTSDYRALQIQFQRRLSRGLQALASYTWSHSTDTGSAGSTAVISNALVPSSIAGSNRGPSDFDIRNAFSAGVTYEIPVPKSNAFAHAILDGWSAENFVIARSTPPVDVNSSIFNGVSVTTIGGFQTFLRPDVVPSQPLYLRGSQYPGGRAFNPAAFTAPPIDPITHVPLRNGNLGRNALRGFDAVQWDFAVHRDFPIRESLRLQFRAEMFNVLNHPNFGPPDGTFSDSRFGLSTVTLGQYLSGSNVGSGGLSPLYQIGGPRSVQFALKLMF